MKENIDHNALIKRCIDGEDSSAWEVFVKAYSRLIWSSVQKTFNSYSFRYSPEDIEDIYSSVFLSLIENDFKKLRQFRSENACTLPTWLGVITIRMTIDHIRKDKSHFFVEPAGEGRDVLEDVPDRRHCAERLLEEKQMGESLRKSVEILSSQDKAIYELLFKREVSPEEAAKILGLSVANVYSRKHRIAEKIKKSMQAM